MVHGRQSARVADMTITIPTNVSPAKAAILRNVYRFLYPGRVERLLDGGIDFVPGKREGYRIWDVDGRELLDLHLNGGTFNLGHRNPQLSQLLVDGLDNWDIGNHHFGSAPKAALAEALVKASPGDMQYVVLTSSGSEAIDVAIKSARRTTGRRRIVAIDSGYHGRTGLSGAAGNDEAAHYFFSDAPDEFRKVPFNDLAAMRAALEDRSVAAVLMESMPATAGFPVPKDDYLPGVAALCREFGALYVADEVQTGLGRTGKLWAIEHWNVEPDILVTGKGLSGGLYPVAAAILSDAAGDWLNDFGWGHVSTFGGSDLGCVIARKVLETCKKPEVLDNARWQASYLAQGLQRLAERFPFLEEVRQKGLVMGLRFSSPSTGLAMMRAFYENGIWAIVAGFDESVIQFKPGLLIDQDYCDELLRRVENALVWYLQAMNDITSGGQVSIEDPQMQPVLAIAKKALEAWGLQGAELDLVKHRENSVFKVSTGDGARFALRVHRAGYHSDNALNSELTWMEALRKSGILTPRVVPTMSGALYAVIAGAGDERQCDLLEWIDGQLFNDLGRVERGMKAELCDRYRKLGLLAAKVHNFAEGWQKPDGFERLAWDEEGLVGKNSLWGAFWEHPLLSRKQSLQIRKARIVLFQFLKKLGKDPENYGLLHADFLPENILFDGQNLTLIDFDDCGFGWHLFEMATSLFPQINQPFFDDLVTAYVEGYRQERSLADEQLEIFPAFLLIRGLTYLGWLNTRGKSLKYSDRLAQEIIRGLMEFMPELMQQLTPLQKLGVNLAARFD